MSRLKRKSGVVAALLVLAGLAATFLATSAPERHPVDPKLKRFAEAKKAHAASLVRQQELEMPADGWKLFDAIREGRWKDATNSYEALEAESKAILWFQGGHDLPEEWKPGIWRRLKHRVADAFSNSDVEKRSKTSPLETEVWTAVEETYHAFEQFRAWDNGLLHLFGEGVISVVPSNSIYFGG